MSNLIERLRSNFPTTQAQWEAADRIEELEAERDELKAALDRQRKSAGRVLRAAERVAAHQVA